MDINNTARQVRAWTLDGLDKIQAADAAIKNLEAQQRDYSPEKYRELMAVQVENRAEIVRSYERKVDDAITEFVDSCKAQYTPKGEEITPDAALLSSPLALTREDLERLFDKHEGNYTMQRMIYEHAAAVCPPGIDRTFDLIGPNAQKAATMKQYFNSVMQRPEYDDIWRNEDWYYATVVGD